MQQEHAPPPPASSSAEERTLLPGLPGDVPKVHTLQKSIPKEDARRKSTDPAGVRTHAAEMQRGVDPLEKDVKRGMEPVHPKP